MDETIPSNSRELKIIVATLTRAHGWAGTCQTRTRKTGRRKCLYKRRSPPRLMNDSGQAEIVVCRAFTAACLSRQAASSRFHCCFAAKVDFRADSRQSPLMDAKKTAKNAGGRPRGSRLDRPEYQRLLSLAIAKRGKPENCWQGICSGRSFLEWKKRSRKTWEALRDAALNEHALQASLSAPDILEKAMSRLREKIDANELNARELLETVKYFDARRDETK